MTLRAKFLSAMTGAALLGGTAGAQELNVAYFLEWPMPFQYAKETGMYEDALGMEINWRAFDTGTAMSAAMASGDIHLSVSQGVPPFVVATSAGQDLQILDVAVSYAENDNCVVQAELEIDKDSADELEGKKVAVPLGTAAHYGFLRQMDHFGLDISTMDIVDMAPPDRRAIYTAIANSVIGVILLASGVFGALAALGGAALTLALFAVMALGGAWAAYGLKELGDG